MVEIETLLEWSVVPIHKSLAEIICPLPRHMTRAHVGAGRGWPRPWCGRGGRASVPVSETKATAEGERWAARPPRPAKDATHTHTPDTGKGETRGRGCEMVGWRARRQGDTEVDMC